MPQDSVLPSQQPPDPSDARPKQNQQNEVVRLQSEITNEIARDAPEIATSIFGDNADHPDMAQVSNQQLDQVYRQKFLSGSPDDRQWLQGEARRDPAQFLKIAERINVKLPEPTPPPELPPPAPPMPGADTSACSVTAPADGRTAVCASGADTATGWTCLTRTDAWRGERNSARSGHPGSERPAPAAIGHVT